MMWLRPGWVKVRFAAWPRLFSEPDCPVTKARLSRYTLAGGCHMSRRIIPLHPTIRARLDVPANMPDVQFLRAWRSNARRVCKPCWELRYCPYGPLVEQSPLLPTTLDEALEHHLYLITCLEGGVTPDGAELTTERRRLFRAMVRDFRPEDHPLEIPQEIASMSLQPTSNGFALNCAPAFDSSATISCTTSETSGRWSAG
jgi:hypothetical protein